MWGFEGGAGVGEGMGALRGGMGERGRRDVGPAANRTPPAHLTPRTLTLLHNPKPLPPTPKTPRNAPIHSKNPQT